MNFVAARARLIECLSVEIKDERVLAAMASVPRECFVPLEYRSEAYEDKPLPIGYDQTISQPYIVALMTQALELTGKEKVLEVGSGSGYHAAVLANLARKVIAVERLLPLAEMARKVLESLGYGNIEVKIAEETLGWQRQAPYDAIVVSAAAPRIPPDLLAQLRMGGRMVIPIGSRWTQALYKITKRRGKNTVENLGGCRFVPLIGRDAWKD